ncbi:MAG: helix-turn-helix transcriptional regulator [Rhodothermales bacterium]|nr:helix-turn-helix transcriptional regulator [Rhodothermales bacterium]
MRNAIQRSLQSPTTGDELVAQLTDLIHERIFETDLYLTGAYRALGANRRDLPYRFSRVHGQKPREYVSAVRLRAARSLLSFTDESITGISFLLGYGSSNAFSMAFRRWALCSPREYRERALQTRADRTAHPVVADDHGRTGRSPGP